MEDGNGSALIVRENLSVSPTILYNESPQEEPMILEDMKMLPANYCECEFPDLVDLIGMLSQILHMKLAFLSFTCHYNEYANVYDSSHVNAVNGNQCPPD